MAIDELLLSINWFWYLVSVLLVFFLGVVWFILLFGKAWAWAARIVAASNDKEVIEDDIVYRAGFNSVCTMLSQFLSTLLMGMVYFLVTPFSTVLSLIIAVSVSAWMKSIMRFEIRNWRRFITLAAVDVGYFFVSSLIFIGFALL